MQRYEVHDVLSNAKLVLRVLVAIANGGSVSPVGRLDGYSSS